MYAKENMPDVESIIDPRSGYAINVPLGMQQTKEFWDRDPQLRDRLLTMRKMAGIKDIVDFPAPPPPTEWSEDDRPPLHMPSRPRRIGVKAPVRPPVGEDRVGDIKFLQTLLETKAGVRRVRTPEGARRFGKPIGSVITRADVIAARTKRSGTKKPKGQRRKAGKKPRVANLTYTEDAKKRRIYSIADIRKDRDLSSRKRTQEAEKNVQSGAIQHTIGAAWGQHRVTPIMPKGVVIRANDRNEEAGNTKLTKYRLPNGGMYEIMADTETGGIFANIYEAGKNDYVSRITADADDIDDLIEAANQFIAAKKTRLSEISDDYDNEGKWHRNRRKRDYDGVAERWAGVRGWDFEVEEGEGDINWKKYEQRLELAQKDAHEMGYTIGDAPFYEPTKGKLDMNVIETVNALIRTHDDMYPGMANLFDSISLSDSRKQKGIAWNATTELYTDIGEERSWNGLGMSNSFYSSSLSSQRSRLEQIDTTTGEVGNVDGDMTFHAVPPKVLMDAHDWDEQRAFTTMTMTHEIGHTVGYILQGRLHQNGDPKNGRSSVTDFHRQRMLEIFEDYGFLKKDRDKNPLTDDAEQQRWMHIGQKGFTAADPFDRSAIKEHLSEYGSTNVSEIMAETWTAYQLHPNPGDYVREMGELMEAALLDFLAEEDPDKRYKPLSVQTFRNANGMQSTRPAPKMPEVGGYLKIGDFNSNRPKKSLRVVNREQKIVAAQRYNREVFNPDNPSGRETYYMQWDNVRGWVEMADQSEGARQDGAV